MLLQCHSNSNSNKMNSKCFYANVIIVDVMLTCYKYSIEIFLLLYRYFYLIRGYVSRQEINMTTSYTKENEARRNKKSK